MSTLLDLLLQRPVSQAPVVSPEETRPKRRRRGWRRFGKPTKAERIAAAIKLDEELRARRAAWADSLKRPGAGQDQFGRAQLQAGVEAVGQGQEGQEP